MKRIMVVAIWALFQLGLLIYLAISLDFTYLTYLAQIISGIILSLYILSDRSKLTTSKLSWITIVLALPGIGAVLFFLFGFGKMASYKKRVLESSKITYKYERSYLADSKNLDERQRKLVGYLDNMNYRTSFLQKASDFTTYTSGRLFFDDIIKDIRSAKKYIHLEFYIIKDGVLLTQIINELIPKAMEGLEIRIITDGLGGRFISYYNENLMKANNIQLIYFNKPKLNAFYKTTNFRDHRKIAIIDGRISYTGGYNIGDEYIDLSDYYGHWQDFAIRIENSSVVSEFETYFAQHWYFETQENLLVKDYYPIFKHSTLEGDTYVYPYVDGPDSDETFVRDMFIKAIMQANKRIVISSPYFIPDSVLYDSLILQARSGVEIILITPGLPDKKIVKLATESYYYDLQNVGVKVYEYNGFIHSKKLLIDDDIAIVGTANFDMRSFNLSFEVCTLLMNGPVLKDINNIFNQEIGNSKLVPLVERKGHVLKRLLQVILRLFAPLF